MKEEKKGDKKGKSKDRSAKNEKSKEKSTKDNKTSVGNLEKHKEAQRLKIEHLTDEITLLKKQVASNYNSTSLLPNTLKAQINDLEMKIMNQTSQLMRLEDKYGMLERAYKTATALLQKSHTDVMDAEELNYITESIENKKNDLLSSRNFITEIQKIGYVNMPVKVADECKKTYLELEYLTSTTRNYKAEVEDCSQELKEKAKELQIKQDEYNNRKEINNELENELEEINNELDVLTKVVNSKNVQAQELDKAVKDIETEINKALEEQAKLNMKSAEEQERIRLEKEKQIDERKLRNKEIEDLQLITTDLQKTLNTKEQHLKTGSKQLKDLKELLSEYAKYNLADLRNDWAVLNGDITTLRETIVTENKLKMEYFNILEDMLGKIKTVCRIRDGAPNNTLHIDDDSSVTLLKDSKLSFSFDHFFNTDSSNENIFAAIEYLYEMAFEGFNCYIITVGGKQSGKSYTTIGTAENGLMWLGLKKIRDLIKLKKKEQLPTRMFVCAVEIQDDIIFDLIEGHINKNIEVKKDSFKMTVLASAQYIECFRDDEVKKILKNALQNRTTAANDFNSKDSTFVFLVTFQIYNKFQHRYFKGKVTHVKLASFDKVEVLISELNYLIKNQEMNYKKNKLTMLLQDCFGGSAKTCIIGAINPSSENEKETRCTLRLVAGMKSIINEMTRNSEPEEIYRLKNDIERLLRGEDREPL